MDDKELLERAANAAIVAGHEIEFHGGSNSPTVYKDDGLTLRGWNPLESLTDAAELALLRSINVVFLPDRVYAGLTIFETYIDHASKRKAYCRAVTRAAATCPDWRESLEKRP